MKLIFGDPESIKLKKDYEIALFYKQFKISDLDENDDGDEERYCPYCYEWSLDDMWYQEDELIPDTKDYIVLYKCPLCGKLSR